MGELETIRRQMQAKAMEMAEKLAVRGSVVASSKFRNAMYDGPNDVSVSIVRKSHGYSIEAEGESVLFIEFGSGIRYGYGHQQAEEFGFGPGTWSDGPNGKGHWANEKGWFLPKEKGGYRTFGNPPAMAMYDAAKEIKENLADVASEVFDT